MRIGIDVRSRDAAQLVRQLRTHKKVQSAELGDVYFIDPAWRQVLVETDMTMEEVDDWLWKRTNVEYAGFWEVT